MQPGRAFKPLFMIILILALGTTLLAMDDARLLRSPDISGHRIVFVYGGDLWTVADSGGSAVRLTSHPGIESAPMFSPDGRWIAFSGQYDGNTDVYVIPSSGGVPRRLTYHPGDDTVTGWSPDGRRVLFSSPRESAPPRYARMFSVSVNGSLPEALPLPTAYRGDYSPDATLYAYTPLPDAFTTWRNYRGGRAPYIWIYHTADHSVWKVPHETANDTMPQWVGHDIVFLSDRDRVMNLYACAPGSDTVKRITSFTGSDIKSFGTDGTRIVFERDGYLNLLDPSTGRSRKLTINVPTEALDTRPHFVKVDRLIRNWNLSPTGQRIVVEARGEILTVPARNGDVRNLTRSVGAAEREPSWSPDGRWVAYFGEHDDEYALILADRTGRAAPRIITLSDPTYYHDINWSPDSKKITFKDIRLHLLLMDLETETVTTVDTDTYYYFNQDLNARWSPDGKWITYEKLLDNFFRAVYLYSVDSGTRLRITDGMSDAYSPAFDAGGKYLYFIASTNRAQGVAWQDMSSFTHRETANLYAVVLARDTPSPFRPQSDEEKVADPATGKDGTAGEAPITGTGTAANGATPGTIRVDPAGITDRIVAVPVPTRTYIALHTGSEGQIFYLAVNPSGRALDLHRYSLAERKDSRLLSGISDYRLTPDGKTLAYRQGANVFIVPANGTPKPGVGRLKTTGMQVWSDPVAEWRQMAREAWRINREWFYDPGMHGRDWPAIWKRYAAWLPYVAHRSDLSYVIGQMIGELSTGHAYVIGGDYPAVKRVPGGLLGADFEVVDGHYRIRKIYHGENWNPGLRAPLCEPGIKAAEGDYILAINGRVLTAADNIFDFLQNTANHQVRIRLNQNPSMEGSREITVVPLAGDTALRYREWIESNRRRVDKMSGGRLAYVYLPDTSVSGFSHFNRYYFAQIDRQAVVVDERFNAGGRLADYFLQFLHRPLTSWWVHRYGKRISSPFASIYGPELY